MRTTYARSQSYLYVSFLFVFSLSLTSCAEKNINNLLDIHCDNNYEFRELKSTTDTRGNFEMKIPLSWKKEMFVNQNETRLYFADTTRQLNETFIIDIGLNFSKTKIDSTFIREIKKQIQENKNTKLIKESKITLKEKPGFVIQTKIEELSIEKNCIEIYLNNKNDSYYILKIDAYGKENIESRFCEAIQLLNHLDLR